MEDYYSAGEKGLLYKAVEFYLDAKKREFISNSPTIKAMEEIMEISELSTKIMTDGIADEYKNE